MADKRTRTITVPPKKGVLRDFVSRLKLILRLIGDPRVSPWVKLIPVGVLVYWVSPIDILMGIPGISALDDAAVIWVGSTLFVELCPPEVVKEHMKQLESTVQDASEEIVDAETTDVNNNK